MWSTAIYIYGLTEDQFWEMTLAQFHALGRVREAEQTIEHQRQDYGFGTLASLTYNFNRDMKQDPSGKDWFFWYPEWAVKAKIARQKTPEELHEYWLNNAMPAINSRAKALREKEVGKYVAEKQLGSLFVKLVAKIEGFQSP